MRSWAGMLQGGNPDQSGKDGADGARNGSRTLNLAMALVLICANLAAFFLGGYHTLGPYLFLAGLACAFCATVWMAWCQTTREFSALLAVTIGVAIVDEYAHTVSGVFTYFDKGTPSLLTVFGWGPFVALIVVSATCCRRFVPFRHRAGWFGVGLPLLSVIMIAALAKSQGYLGIIGWELVLVYGLMGLASLYYCCTRPLGWGLSAMACSVALGAGMEYVGSVEGLWSFHFGQPLCLFMVFVWALRVWTILAVCSLLGISFAKRTDKP